MKIKSNLSEEEQEIIKEITRISLLAYVPQTKEGHCYGKQRKHYQKCKPSWMKETRLNGRKEKTILDELHNKLTPQVKIMDIGLKDKNERYQSLS